MKKHQKHAKLAKPTIGNFHRNELALVGAPCHLIQELSEEIIARIPGQSVTYIDADHAFGDSSPEELRNNSLTDKIRFFRHDKKQINTFDQKILLNDQELILVNGNHFEAQSQIVLIHPKKEASLKKRHSQLSNVKAIILCEGIDKPFEWLADRIQGIPVLNLSEIDSIAKLVDSHKEVPKIKGLVLAGGKSTRMGEDKGQIAYHGLAQVDYLIAEFEKLGIEPLVSCRDEQYIDYKRITDLFEGLGPFGAIASAFQYDPNVAWLVTACDLPAVNASVFNELISARDASKTATCFYNEETEFPDPLITLWEPKSYMRLMEFLALGYSCPRKVLINSNIKMIKPSSANILKNINTPEERESFIS